MLEKEKAVATLKREEYLQSVWILLFLILFNHSKIFIYFPTQIFTPVSYSEEENISKTRFDEYFSIRMIALNRYIFMIKNQ